MTERSERKIRQGIVVSDAREKTITVEIEDSVRHPKYGKVVRRTKRFHAHDATNDANAGDTVRIVETRPVSKTVRWRLLEVIERAR
jgi:small subunit ribosomal protein S17